MGDMEGFMFSTPMFISQVDGESHIDDEMIVSSVPRELFASEDEPILEPYEGMEFESEEAAKAFYNQYAAQAGFKVRVSSFIRSKRDKTVISRQLVCSREGFRSKRDASGEGKTKRPRMVTRVGCRAMIMVKKHASGNWVISKCEKLHNHVLGSQDKVMLLDYDPYAREDEEMIGSSTGGDESLFGGPIGYPLDTEVVPPEGDPSLEPNEDMEFESEKAAQIFYKEYARRVGFRARVSNYYRSKRDNSIISRLIVCSKEGYRAKKDETAEERLHRPRTVTRIGCKAMMMVKKRDSGKWAVTKLLKSHNHPLTLRTVTDDERSEAEDNAIAEMGKALVGSEGEVISEPYVGFEFESEEAAKVFYFAYSRHVGFDMRVSTYYRSKRDNSMISRLFVCSKEGFSARKDGSNEAKMKSPRELKRVGCKAMLMVKKNTSGKWVVSKFETEHNHPLGSLKKMRKFRKRKRLSVNPDMPENQIEPEQGGQGSTTSRFNNLCREAIKYAEAGSASADVYNVAVHALREATEKVTAIKKNARGLTMYEMVGGGCNSQVESDCTIDQESMTRTRPSNPLPMPNQEISLRSRMCNNCEQPIDHNVGGCPTMQIFEQVNFVHDEGINAASEDPISELIMCDHLSCSHHV